MNPKDLPWWGDITSLKPLANEQFKKLVLEDLIDWVNKQPQPDPEHSCGCGNPNAKPPCWHCTDCRECYCKYCGDTQHTEDDDCPVLMNPMGYKF